MPALAHLDPDHDELLIARLAAGDLGGQEEADARSMVAACPACAQVHADVHALIAATEGLPAPRRTRDFRLTDADSARLRKSGWRRLLGRFGDPRLAFTRPLATGLVALGIAGLVLAAAPSFFATAGAAGTASALAPGAPDFNAAQASTGSESTTYGPYALGGAGAAGGGGDARGSVNLTSPAPSLASVASTAPSIGALQASTAPAASAPVGPPTVPADTTSSAPPVLGVAASPAPPAPAASVIDQNPSVGKSIVAASSDATTPWLVVGSIVVLLAGIGLFVLRWASRRQA